VLHPQEGNGALEKAQKDCFREQDDVSAHLGPAWVFLLAVPLLAQLPHFKLISAI